MQKRIANFFTHNRLLLLGLVGIAIASELIYGSIFNEPAHFLVVAPRSNVYQDYLYSAPPSARWWVIAAFILLGILYALGWVIARRIQGRTAWGIVMIASLAFGVLMSYIYPIDASDLFNNIINGRIRTVYHANPYVQVADDFKGDEFFPLVSWSYLPTTYGPVWELLAEAAVRFAGNDLLSNVLALKWLPGIFLLASAVVVAFILRKQGSPHVLAGVLLLAWNPVAIYEVWGNGHNDIVMVFFILLGVLAVLYKRFTLSILALAAGVMVKFIPLLLIPAAGLIALREISSTRNRIRFLLITPLVVLLFGVLVYIPFWQGPQVLTVFQRTKLFTTSLPAVIFELASPKLGQGPASEMISLVALILTSLFALWQAWRAYRDRSSYSFAQASFNILTFYLLVTCLWFQQWYTVWLIGLAPVLASGAAQLFGILFGFLALSKQLFMFPLVIWPSKRPPEPQAEIMFTLGVLGLPWLIALALLLRKYIAVRSNGRNPPPTEPS